MAVTFTTVFTTLGKIGGAYRNINGFRGATAPASAVAWGASGPAIKDTKTAFDDIAARFTSSLQYLTEDLFSERDALRSAVEGSLQSLATRAANYVVEVVNADTPLAAKTIDRALAELISQMDAASESVKAATVSAAVTAGGSNIGDAQLVCGVKGPDGLSREYVVAETITATVTQDRNGGTDAGSEVLTVTSPAASTSSHAYDWPTGSGLSTTLTVVDPELDAQTTGNLLTNSDFEDFTTNVPDSWSILVGTAGTSVLKSTSPTFGDGTASLQFVGDDAELTSIAQTLTTLEAATVYAFNAWVRVDVTPANGTLAFELVDGSNAIIADDAGTNNQTTKALTGVSTPWVAVNGFFRTPTNLPSTIKMRVRLSAALEDTRSVYVDYLALTPATELYTGGPYAAVFRGATDVILRDVWTTAIANNMTANGAVFQNLFQRWFDMRGLGLQLPSSGAPTQADSLVS